MPNMPTAFPEIVVHHDPAKAPALAGTDFYLDSLVKTNASNGREMVGLYSKTGKTGRGRAYRTSYLDDLIEDTAALPRRAAGSEVTAGITIRTFEGMEIGTFEVIEVVGLDPFRWQEMNGSTFRGHYRVFDLRVRDESGVIREVTIPTNYISIA